LTSDNDINNFNTFSNAEDALFEFESSYDASSNFARGSFNIDLGLLMTNMLSVVIV